MEQNKMVLDRPGDSLSLEELEDLFGEQHIATSYDTPLRNDAFDLSDEEKIKIISRHFREIMLTLGPDLQDDSLKGTGCKDVCERNIQRVKPSKQASHSIV